MLKYSYVTAEAALEGLKSGGQGLSPAEAAQRLKTYGPNAIQREKKSGVIKLFFSQFGDIMTLLLVAAALISGAVAIFSRDFSDLTDTIIIVAIIALNAVFGTVQQYRADRAIESLKQLSAPTAAAIRGGRAVRLPAADLVPGDIVRLEEGDLVPADCRILSSANLRADESSLTGESQPVEKREGVIQNKNTPLGNTFNMLFCSTFVVRGNATAVVTGTGRNTQIGAIADMLEGENKGKTPLERTLARLGRIITLFVLCVAAAVFAFSSLARGQVLQSFMTAVAVAVAAIPEGLPAVVTIIMAIGVTRMSRSKVIIRKLKAVETLGGCTCICTDKTGTLTRNRMEVKEVWQCGGELLTCMAACNNARGGVGDPTEVALMDYAVAHGARAEYARTGENAFSSERAMMSVVLAGGATYVKGAPDVIIKRCTRIAAEGGDKPLGEGDISAIHGRVNSMSDRAMRVLAFAVGSGGGEQDLTFLGVAGLADGLKEGIREAVEECRRAGITTVMITGDHARTALAIAKQAGICYDPSLVYSGGQLDGMTKRQRAAAIRRGRVFARVTPAHKNLIVKIKRAAGEVVAMTGDGVNDAPSIKSADIGIAMGRGGTEVTKSVADMVIADDHFATIVSAVREGRRISANIRKTINFYLSTNLAEVLAILIATMAYAGSSFLHSTQLLWLNLITDSFPVLALGAERGEEDAMLRPPERAERALLGASSLCSIACSGAYICGVTLFCFAFGLAAWGNAAATTTAFLTLSFAELFHAFNVRRERRSAFGRGALSNKILLATVAVGVAANIVLCLSPLASAFGMVALSRAQWAWVFGLSLSVIAFGELYKFAFRLLSRRRLRQRRGAANARAAGSVA